NSEPKDIAIDGGDAPEFVVLTIAGDAFVDFRQVREHSFDEWLREELDVVLRRAERPEFLDRFRSVATVKIAPEMVLERGSPRGMTFAHCYLRRSAMRLAISKAARAASVPRLCSSSRQRFLA